VEFADRAAAGRRLAGRLRHLRGPDLTVVGLPRGGVPVAAEVARVLGAPLDVIMVRKLGLPSQPELAMGAIGEGGVRVLDEDLLRRAGVSGDELRTVEARERVELRRRAGRLRGGRPATSLSGRRVVLVDDGVATGASARAACQVARAAGARRVILAVPVAPPGWTGRLGDVADEMICVTSPAGFRAVGQVYDDFHPMDDDEVLACLAAANPPRPPPGPGGLRS
jgi:putative phosphoribosyl transferase